MKSKGQRMLDYYFNNPDIRQQIKEEEKRRAKEQKLEDRKERAAKMVELYKEGWTYQKIGEVMECTRERVRQLLVETLGAEMQVIKKKNMEKRKADHAPKLHRLVCKKCRKPFYKKNYKAVYCSMACYKDHKTINEYPDWVAGRSIHPKNFTKDEWRQINTLKQKQYWHRNRAEMNKKARKWQKKNKGLQAIYSKRWEERQKYGHAITPLPEIKNNAAVKP